MNAPPLIPRDVLFGNPDKISPKISPDGTMLVYQAPSGGVLSVWVRTIGKDDDRVVAHDPARPIPWCAWQGDSRHVLYLQDRAGNENYHVFRVALDGEPAVEITPGDEVRTMPLAVSHRFPNEILITTNARDAASFDVARVDLGTGRVVLDTENPGDVAMWRADNAFVVRAAVAVRADGSSCIRVRDAAGSPWRTLDEIEFADGTPRLVAFSPDDRELFVITAKDANAARLMRYDLETGAATVVASDPQYDVEDVYVDPATNALAAVALSRARIDWTVIDPQFTADFATLRGLHPGDFKILAASSDGNTLVVLYTSDTEPPAYFIYDRRTKRAAFLFRTNDALLEYALAPMEPIVFAARDGLEIHGYLTLPAGVEPRKLPTVVLVHGGPWWRDRWGYDASVQWLANRGYAVLQVNFRGSTGYGKDFLNAGDREWAGAMRTDLLDARDWAIAQGYADPARVGIFGGSYGGYAVLAALAFTPDAFACGVDVVGPSNLNAFLAAIPAYWEQMRSMLALRVGEDPAFLDAQSPIHRAGEICAPLLIAHGANDPRVAQRESDQIVETLRAKGIPVTYVVFENEGHDFADPANNKRLTAVTERFFAETLGGRVQPPQPGEEIEPFLR